MRFPWNRESRVWGKIEEISINLSVLDRRLSARVDQMSRRCREIFEQCVRSYQEGDPERASVYASELSQLRKSLNTALKCQLSLEAVIYRLATVKDLGDVRVALQPVKGIVSRLGGEIHGVLPEVSSRVGEIQEMLNDVSLEIGTVEDGGFTSPEPAEEEARRILAEAAEVASRRKSSISE
jgi:division protein CdvB (Snf7/Vps24/ESCRT-III family)